MNIKINKPSLCQRRTTRALHHTLLFIILFFSHLSYANSVFFDGFENSSDNSLWKLNVGPNGPRLTNKWFISNFKPYMGSNCLLISDVDGSSSNYSNTKNTSVAYREYSVVPGVYDLSFMWRCLGENHKDVLYVVWVPATTRINSSMAGVGNLVLSQAISFGDGPQRVKALAGESSWTEATTQVKVNGAPGSKQLYRLYFIWDNDAAGSMSPAAAVDNIQLAMASCTKPTNIVCSMSGGRLDISWQGSASEYDVQYKLYGKSETNVVRGIKGFNTTISDVPEGLYDVFVRSICGQDTSIWALQQNVLVYNSDSHCIDFINLDAKGVECRTGTYESPNSVVGKVDMGFNNEQSRHTIHFLPDELDIWSTEGKLSTVPPGEIVSVRLGNPINGNEQESVTYTYKLKPNEQIIMLVKYAVVFEEPGHEENNEFRLEILDKDGKLLPDKANAGCSFTQFFANDDPEWDKSVSRLSGGKVSYKNWTTVGVDLTQYAGQTIKIRLSTFDCGWGGHYTYAYYTISCAQAALSGFSCGDSDVFEVTAPDGFNYKWYKPDDPTKILGTSQTFSVSALDADTFYCDVIFKENPNCYFTLPAYLVPRLPVSNISAKWCPTNCTNMCLFENIGGVLCDSRLTKEKCEYVEWTITDNTTGKDSVFINVDSVLMQFPDNGDTLSIRLVSGISGNQCTDTFYMNNYIVPAIGYTDTTIIKQVCQAELPYVFSGRKYFKSGIYSNRDIPGTNISFAGCDSIVTLDLRVIDKIDTIVYDTICMGDTLKVGNNEFYRSSKPDNPFYTTIPSSKGCDSLIILHLHVMPAVDVVFDSIADICADNETFDLKYNVKEGDLEYCSIQFDPLAKSQGFVDVDSISVTADGIITISMPDAMPIPDYYSLNILFHTSKCGVREYPVNFTVLYPVNDIMQQKWNDVITLLNKDNNYGGFEYSSYQWYRNNKPIAGATNSYLYVNDFDFDELSETDTYRVALVRKGESRSIMSCELVPVDRSSLSVSEYVVVNQAHVGSKLKLNKPVKSNVVAVWYNVSGQVVSKQYVEADESYLNCPQFVGMYILYLLFDDGVENHKIFIVE